MRYMQFDNNFYPAEVENEISAMMHSIIVDEVGRMIVAYDKIERNAIMKGTSGAGPNGTHVLCNMN
jgi:hypothetical protein